MKTTLKTLTLITTGLVVGVVVERVKKSKIPTVTVKVELENKDEYEKLLSDIRNFKPKWKQVKNHNQELN